MLQQFLNLPRLHKRLISVVADVIMLSFALWVSFSLRLEQWFWVPSTEQLVVGGLTVVFTIAAFVRLGLYRAVIRYLSDKAFGTVVVGVGASILLLILLGFWFEVMIPRSVPVIYGALAFIFVSGTRMGVRILVASAHNNSNHNRERVIIIGAGETGLQLCQALQQGTEYKPVAFISFKEANYKSLIHGLPVFKIDHIEKVLRLYGGDRLLLALDVDSGIDRRALIKQLEPLSVPVQTVPSMSELIAGQKRINDIRDLELEDLLGREPVRPDNLQLTKCLQGRVVMVTGAGGSIGSELCRQIIQHRPEKLVLFEQSEFSLYRIERELSATNDIEGLGVGIYPLLGNVAHRRRCEVVMAAFGVSIVYHAAAYKHVPLVENNVIEGVQNNVMGTWHLAEAAIAAGVERFVLVSTDKAVRPTNIMGASKRMAELVLQGLAHRQSQTVFSMVRFGNVLGSSGSVVPLFRDQIRDGGPVTVTHPDIIRYFMTIPEASQLVLQAGSMGQGGEVFVLDMGEPVRILDLARKMIRLMGLTEKTEDNPEGDIPIVYTGLRPGEKLYEELLIGSSPQGTAHPRILMAKEAFMPWGEVQQLIENIASASRNFDCKKIVELLQTPHTAFTPAETIVDLVCCNGGVAAPPGEARQTEHRVTSLR